MLPQAFAEVTKRFLTVDIVTTNFLPDLLADFHLRISTKSRVMSLEYFFEYYKKLPPEFSTF